MYANMLLQMMLEFECLITIIAFKFTQPRWLIVTNHVTLQAIHIRERLLTYLAALKWKKIKNQILIRSNSVWLNMLGACASSGKEGDLTDNKRDCQWWISVAWRYVTCGRTTFQSNGVYLISHPFEWPLNIEFIVNIASIVNNDQFLVAEKHLSAIGARTTRNQSIFHISSNWIYRHA